jgi:hypothetical protein
VDVSPLASSKNNLSSGRKERKRRCVMSQTMHKSARLREPVEHVIGPEPFATVGGDVTDGGMYYP